MLKFIKNMKIEIELSNQKYSKDADTPHMKFMKLCMLPDLISINLHIIKNELFKYISEILMNSIIKNYILTQL